MAEIETVTVSHGQGKFVIRTYTINRHIQVAEISGNGLQTLRKTDLCAIIVALSRARDRMK